MITLLVDPEGLDGGELEVAGGAYRHLFRARRVAVGDRLRIVDGQGRARWGEVVRVERAAAAVALGAAAPAHEPAQRLELLVATLRPERAAWLVEKATELGVAAVRFLHSERAPRRYGEGTRERLRRVAAAAVEQCHRSCLPEVSGPHSWSDLERLTAAAAPGARWVLDPAAPPSGAPSPPAGRAALLVGPEGGWSESERHGLAAAGWQALGLGPRVLREETAAIVGSALLLAGTG